MAEGVTTTGDLLLGSLSKLGGLALVVLTFSTDVSHSYRNLFQLSGYCGQSSRASVEKPSAGKIYDLIELLLISCGVTRTISFLAIAVLAVVLALYY